MATNEIRISNLIDTGVTYHSFQNKSTVQADDSKHQEHLGDNKLQSLNPS